MKKLKVIEGPDSFWITPRLPAPGLRLQGPVEEHRGETGRGSLLDQYSAISVRETA